MKINVCLWILLGLFSTVQVVGQTPVKKRIPIRRPLTSQKVVSKSIAGNLGLKPVNTEKLAKQIVESLHSDSTINGLKIPIPELKIDPITLLPSPESRSYLDSLAVVLNQMPTLLFDINVYRLALENSERSKAEAEKQAKAILAYLTVNGKVAAYRSHYGGFTILHTTALPKTSAGRGANQHIELSVKGFDTNQDVVLTRSDSTRLVVVFAYKDDTSGIVYYKPTTNAPLLNLTVDQVNQITYRPHIDNTLVVTPLPNTQPIQIENSSTARTHIDKPNRANYRSSAFTIGVEGLYVPPTFSPQWADEALGLGLRQGIGGSIAFTRRFGRWVGLSAQTGYGQWEVQRLYTLKGETQYDEQVTFNQLFLKVGLKIYVWNSLYIMPEATLQGLQMTTKTGEKNPISMLHDKQQGLYAGYGGSLGYDLRIRRFAIDISTFYIDLSKTLQPIVWYYSLTNPLRYIGGRIGIGFQLSRP